MDPTHPMLYFLCISVVGHDHFTASVMEDELALECGFVVNHVKLIGKT
jgi:hypothetical protein